jgi:hypothetical protein
MAHTNGHKSHDLFSTISTLGLLATIAAMSIVGMLKIVEHLRPAVGDIISFDPAKNVFHETESRIEVRPVSTSDVVSCVLDLRHMRQLKGSFIIEATRPDPVFIYRVHWAGGPTSGADASCGESADLLLSTVQITALKMAAKPVA